MLAREGFGGRLVADGRPRPRARRRRRRAPPAPRRRAGRPAARRDVPAGAAAASARRRPAPAASPRRCARSRSCSTSPRRARELAAPGAWIVDFTNPVGIVTRALLDAGHRAVGLCNVAIGFQRRWRRCSASRPSGSLVDQVGLNHLTWVRAVRLDGADVLPELLARPRRRARRAGGGLPRRAARRARRRALVLPALLLRPRRVLAEQLAGATPRAATVAEIERELLELYRDPALDDQAGAARAARRRVLQRGGDARCSPRSPTGDGGGAGGRRAQRRRAAGLAADDVVEVPARVGGTAHPLPQRAARARAARARPARRGLRAARRPRGGRRATRDVAPALLAHPLVGQWARSSDAAGETLLAAPRGRDRERAIVLAVDGGNSKTDLALVRADGAVLALARGPASSPHHVGLDGCLRVLEDLLAEATAAAGPGPPSSRSPRSADVLLAGADLPAEERALQAGVARARLGGARRGRQRHLRGPARRHRARAGASPSCAAPASTASASRPTAAMVRFPALGRDHRRLGRRLRPRARRRSARRRAARTGAGRGPRSSARCRSTSGCATPHGAGEAIHLGADPEAARCSSSRRWCSPRRDGDAVRRELVDRLAAEVVAFARVALDAARRSGEPVDVVLGGGLLRGAATGASRSAIAAGLARGRRRSSTRARRARAADRRRRAAGPRRARRRSDGATPGCARELAVAAGPRQLATAGSADDG